MKLFISIVVILNFALCQISFCQDYWELIDSPEGLLKFDIAVDSEGRIYLACPGPAGDLTGIYRSDDNGFNWDRKIEGMDTSYNPHTRSIAIDNLDNIVVGGNSRIYRSTNHGEGWTEVYNASSTSNFNTTEFGYDSIFFVGGGSFNGIVRSGDNGLTWQIVLDFTTFEPNANEELTAIYFGQNDIIYACSRTFGVGSGSVYISEDYGMTWSVFYNNGFSHFNSIEFDHAERLLVGSNGIHRYDFTTGVWEHQSYNIIAKDILIAPENDIYIADPYNGGGLGVIYSDDNGENYEVLNSGMVNIDSRRFAVDLMGRIFAMGTSSLYRSYDTVIITNIDDRLIENKEFLCYPNPFKHNTIIQSTIEEKATISFINNSGEIVFESIIDGFGTFEFFGEHLTPGLYIVVIKAKSLKKTIKLIHY